MRRDKWRWLLSLSVAATVLFHLAVADANAGETVSLRIVDGEVRDVLVAIARLGGVDIVVDESARGTITLEVNDEPVKKVLELVARAKGLDYHCQNGVVIVGKRESGRSRSNFDGVHIFSLRYIEPQQAVKAAALALTGSVERTGGAAGASEADPAARLTADAGSASLILYGTQREADAVRRILDKVDVKCRQVLLEAKVVAVSKEAAKNLGIEWQWSQIPQSPEHTVEYETSSQTVTDAAGNLQTVTQQIPVNKVKRYWKNGDNIPGIISFGRNADGQPFEAYYAAQLNALVSDGKASVLARPNIMTINGEEATINIGGEVPVPALSISDSVTTTTIEYRKAGIILKYTPRINDDGSITAAVYTEVSNPVYVAELKAYRFSSRSARTNVRLKDGETMIIGGLISAEESKAYSKIPFLGDIPILGRLFNNTKSSKTENEVMIFLTAGIVK